MFIDILVLILLCILGTLVLFYLFVFARDPKRTTPQDQHAIISPADGRVSHIFNTQGIAHISKGKLGMIRSACADVADECTILSIVMTPLDVHFQRAPITGTVTSTFYRRGRFRNAVSNTAEPLLENEHNAILIDGEHTRIKTIQIAGALAQRIRCFVQPKQVVRAGERIGFIDLGSQVTLILPSDVKIHVKKGQYVYGGETILGRA